MELTCLLRPNWQGPGWVKLFGRWKWGETSSVGLGSSRHAPAYLYIVRWTWSRDVLGSRGSLREGETYRKCAEVARSLGYESKFILDSFLFCVSPARILRWVVAIIAFFARSRVTPVTCLGEIFEMVGLYHWLFHMITWFVVPCCTALDIVQYGGGHLIAIHPVLLYDVLGCNWII